MNGSRFESGRRLGRGPEGDAWRVGRKPPWVGLPALSRGMSDDLGGGWAVSWVEGPGVVFVRGDWAAAPH